MFASQSQSYTFTSNLYFFNVNHHNQSTEEVEEEVTEENDTDLLEGDTVILPEDAVEFEADLERLEGEAGAEGEVDIEDAEEIEIPDMPYIDIENHWAKQSILFVLSMNLLEPIDETTFSPDEMITRAEFVSVLGTHAGIPNELPAQYSFFDVKVDAPYAPHVYWATQNKIISGISDDLFLPDDSLTREQMATILVRYTDMMNFKLPVLYDKVEFSDNALISYWAKSSVSALQMAGLLVGNTSGGVNPKGMLTRAEISVVLEKFVTLTNQYGYHL
ncbi:MAG: S-layer homology domain-containing protein [Bacillota bacterium]